MKKVWLLLLLLAAPAFAEEPAPVKPKNVPPHVFESQKVSGEMPHLPDAVKAAAKTSELIWMGKVCAAVDGHITQVLIISGIPGADDTIISTVRGWRIRPQPIPICTLIRFEFMIDRPPPPKKQP